LNILYVAGYQCPWKSWYPPKRRNGITTKNILKKVMKLKKN